MLLDFSLAISGIRVCPIPTHLERTGGKLPFIHMQLYQTLDTHRSISVRLQATPGPCALSKQCGHPVRWCASHPATARPHSALLHAHHLPRATAQTQALHLCHWSPRSDAVSTGCTLLSAFVSRGSPTFPFTGAARPAVVKPQGLRVWSRSSATSQATGTSSALAGTRSCGASVASRVRARPRVCPRVGQVPPPSPGP